MEIWVTQALYLILVSLTVLIRLVLSTLNSLTLSSRLSHITLLTSLIKLTFRYHLTHQRGDKDEKATGAAVEMSQGGQSCSKALIEMFQGPIILKFRVVEAKGINDPRGPPDEKAKVRTAHGNRTPFNPFVCYDWRGQQHHTVTCPTFAKPPKWDLKKPIKPKKQKKENMQREDSAQQLAPGSHVSEVERGTGIDATNEGVDQMNETGEEGEEQMRGEEGEETNEPSDSEDEIDDYEEEGRYVNTHPVWNESFRVPYQHGVDKDKFPLKILNRVNRRINDHVGHAVVDLKAMIHCPFDKWYTLEACNGSYGGRVRLRFEGVKPLKIVNVRIVKRSSSETVGNEAHKVTVVEKVIHEEVPSHSNDVEVAPPDPTKSPPSAPSVAADLEVEETSVSSRALQVNEVPTAEGTEGLEEAKVNSPEPRVASRITTEVSEPLADGIDNCDEQPAHVGEVGPATREQGTCNDASITGEVPVQLEIRAHEVTPVYEDRDEQQVCELKSEKSAGNTKNNEVNMEEVTEQERDVKGETEGDQSEAGDVKSEDEEEKVQEPDKSVKSEVKSEKKEEKSKEPLKEAYKVNELTGKAPAYVEVDLSEVHEVSEVAKRTVERRNTDEGESALFEPAPLLLNVQILAGSDMNISSSLPPLLEFQWGDSLYAAEDWGQPLALPYDPAASATVFTLNLNEAGDETTPQKLFGKAVIFITPEMSEVSEVWYVLEDPVTPTSEAGRILVRTQIVAAVGGSVEDSVGNTPRGESNGVATPLGFSSAAVDYPGVLRLRVISGEGLTTRGNNGGDPYVTFLWRGVQHRTISQKQTSSPVWEEVFELDHDTVAGDPDTLELVVMSEDQREDDFMGAARISLHEDLSTEVSGWFELDGPEAMGQIGISLMKRPFQ
eukprot:GHVN01019163.1.p1 GENE.GHVN01019163.1~~GHVN01019163.1.p1  ORF type:complete len:891 (-),score=194.64 GHVN01019163.1:2123-4795(-)